MASQCVTTFLQPFRFCGYVVGSQNQECLSEFSMKTDRSYLSKPFRILLLLVCFSALPLQAFAAQVEKCNYVEFQRLPLFEHMHGINGSLIIKRDRRFMYEYSAGLDTPETTCNARLYLMDKNNKIVFSKKLEKPIASLETVELLERQPKSFALEEDYSIGWGSYAGPITSFFDVVNGKVKWLQTRQNNAKKIKKLYVSSSLKTGWQIVKAGNNFDILEAACRPEFSIRLDEAAFSITYRRYHYNGTEWIEYSRKDSGYWDFEEYPDIALYPKAQ
ncbi:MAG: hypothetical protein PHF56_20195 [Desulfuromonadaceae bacterium]|nr:hypothetical protein [Desulfuromonadaceae bacterium]